MNGIRRVFVTFLLMLAVFGGTHLLSYPGSVAYFKAATGGEKILDMQASASAAETYQRLQAIGPNGRELYLQLIATADIVFPLAMLVFLLTFARFAADRTRLKALSRSALVALPIIYFGLDLLENASAVAMLLRYPERLDWLGGTIGYLTKGKRAFMLLAVVVPPILLVLGALRGRWRTRNPQRAGATV